MNNATKGIRFKVNKEVKKSAARIFCWLNYSVYLIAGAIQQGVNNST